jgi:hypothetical protein
VIQEEDEEDKDGPPTAEEEDERLCSSKEVVEEEGMSEGDKVASETKGYNINCSKDVWTRGTNLLVVDGVKEKRTIQRRQFEREKQLLETIGKIIKRAKEQRRQTRLKEEIDDVPDSDFLSMSKQLSKFD